MLLFPDRAKPCKSFASITARSSIQPISFFSVFTFRNRRPCSSTSSGLPIRQLRRRDWIRLQRDRADTSAGRRRRPSHAVSWCRRLQPDAEEKKRRYKQRGKSSHSATEMDETKKFGNRVNTAKRIYLRIAAMRMPATGAPISMKRSDRPGLHRIGPGRTWRSPGPDSLLWSCRSCNRSGQDCRRSSRQKRTACVLSSTIAWGLVPAVKVLPSAVRVKVLFAAAIEKPAITPVLPLLVCRLTTYTKFAG